MSYVLWVLICTVHLTVCYYHVTLYSLPECQGTHSSKQVRYVKFKWQQRHRVRNHFETRTWHDNNIQSQICYLLFADYCLLFVVKALHLQKKYVEVRRLTLICRRKRKNKLINFSEGISKNIRELSWMSRGVMCFWFLLNFPFISAFFDIPASLSISRVFSRGF